jgi:Trk-type K+ transport system membrane component
MRLKQPDLWFLVTVLAITAVGAVVLAQSGAVSGDARHLSYSRHYWQVTFDALSASCGVGLLTYSIAEDYTPLGRWVLTALGVVGALLFVSAVAQAARRMQPDDAVPRVPHPLVVATAFVTVQVLAVGVFLLGTGLERVPENSWRAIAAFSSLGWGTEALSEQSPATWALALLAWVGALGWPVWLVVVPRLSRRYVRRRSALTMLGAYALMLLVSAMLISAFETPRGGAPYGRDVSVADGAPLSEEPWPARYVRGLVQATAASGAGLPTESLTGPEPTDGTKFTLAALLLIGGLGGSATGGVQLTLLLWALAGGAAALGGRGKASATPEAARWMHAGLACVLLLLLMGVVVAGGLLLLENWTASRYQPAPSLAGALLDASSVVAGGNLSSGLTEAVTSRNLLSGIRQSANLYQYGMAWLMLAMLGGRLLPLVILRRLGEACSFAGESSSEPARADNK